MMIAPVILIVMAAVLLFGTLGMGFSTLVNGGELRYSEERFQDYTDQEYSKAFGANRSAYEDNLLITVLTGDDYAEYYYIAWVGDNIRTDINNLFGNEQTAFGRAMMQSVSGNYKYSLDSNLAQVMETMGDQIAQLDGDSSFKKDSAGSHAESRLINYTELAMTEETVNSALEEFTANTGIPVVIVVQSMDQVFEKCLDTASVLALILSVVLIAAAVVLLVRYFKKQNRTEA